jgi:hypothetical protein
VGVLSGTSAAPPIREMSSSMQVRYHFGFVGGGNTIIEELK